jgi:lysophospholipase L1-like esterase
MHYQIPSKILRRLGIEPPGVTATNYSYKDNYQYDVRTSLFSIYEKENIHIVMLGDSITQAAEWNELLGRADIANRGIGSDITEGFIDRLPDIYRLNPDMCFIMGGINDIGRNIPPERILQNIKEIIRKLEIHSITPVIQSVLYVSRHYPGWRRINQKVDEINMALREFCGEQGALFLDVNMVLADGEALDGQYTYDGVHLLGNGYEKWRDLILPMIE